ncbi:MAG: ABC transporter permease [Gemmatimonadales bacterium]
MSHLLRDLRYAARALMRTPLFTLGVVLTLALGIGVNAAMFGIVDRLFLRPPEGVKDAGRVVRVYRRATVSLMHQTFTGGIGTFPAFVDLRDAGVFDRAAAVASRPMSLGRGSEAERVATGAVSWDYFPLLGVAPAIGRFFGVDDDKAGADRVAVLSWSLWQRKFAGDSAVVGRVLQIGNRAYTVVGVTAKGFAGIDLAGTELWIPIQASADQTMDVEALTSRNFLWMDMIGRLKPGDRAEDVATRATDVYRRGAVTPDQPDEKTATILLGPIQEVRGPVSNSDAVVSAWVGAVTLAVLLIACANVANLLLARGVGRRRELAVRAGLGAGRGGLIRLILSESIVLSALGGAAAVLLAVWSGGAARSLLAPDLPKDIAMVDGRVLLFTAASVLLTALLTGIVPALQSSRTDLAESLKSGGHGSIGHGGRTRALLLATQVALTLVLLVGAGLFVRSLRNVQAIDLGFDAEKVQMVTINLGAAGIKDADANAIWLRLLGRAQALPGVEHATGVMAPLGWMFATSLRAEGLDSLPRAAGGGPYQNVVTPDYFATLGTRIARGRGFLATDRAGSQPVAAINETMAKVLWPGSDALGKCLYIGGRGEDINRVPCNRVVGVVADAHTNGVTEDPPMQYFVPWGQRDGVTLAGLYVRGRGDPAVLTGDLRRAVLAEGDLPHANIQTLVDALAPQLRSWKLGATAFTAFGALALLIAAMGIFSVISYSVSQRTQEIGIRMALGAESAQVARMILGQGLRAAIIGVVVGGGGAFLLGRGIKALLYQVAPTDPLVFGSTALVLLAVATAAAWFPARRAARVHPMVALRYE